MSETKHTPLEVEKDWRFCFTKALMDRADRFIAEGLVREFHSEGREAAAQVCNRKGTSSCRVRIQDAPDRYEADWDPRRFSCECGSKYMKAVTLDGASDSIRVPVCAHEAAVLLFWEEQHGPWRFQEPPELMEARLERERRAEEERREAERILTEKRRRFAQRREEENEKLSADTFFPLLDGKPDGTFFDVPAAVKSEKTNRYYYNRALSLLKEGKVELYQPTLSYGVSGQQILIAKGKVSDSIESRTVSLSLAPRELVEFECDCMEEHGYWFPYASYPLCEHTLALLAYLREYIRRENPGDMTDLAADSFFRALDAAAPVRDEAESVREKVRNVLLVPRITMDGGAALLSFRAGLLNGKLLILRGYPEFLDAVENQGTFALSKLVSLDFSESDFTEDSEPWLRFLQRRVSETETANEMMERKYNKGYYYSSRRSAALSVGPQDELTGATLDRFYETAEGTECEFQDKAHNINGTIRIGHADIRVSLSSRDISGKKGGFQGMEITGQMPVLLRGSAGSYSFTPRSLSRITREEDQFLQPFRKASDSSGQIRFRVGKNHLAEFYYRVVPQLLASPYVDFEDRCAEKAAPLLPPEPAFAFYLDVADGAIFCNARVSYGDAPQQPLFSTQNTGYQDAVQEKRVDALLRKYFSPPDAGIPAYWKEDSEDNLFLLLTEGVPELARYGQVLGSEAFRRTSLRPVPQFRVSVSIDGGLMDLSILSKDADPAELLDILQSYRAKKRYHRLKNGDFVTLSGDDQFSSLEAMAEGLDLSLEDLILRGSEVPAFRALYLDRLLEAHDALVSSRDRTYRALVRNFASIRDADYEVPAAQSEVLRPYQVYGYKWLRTLAAAGFGGILADEMGLGKTVQAITLIQSLRDEGDRGPMLIVCPASLVFNWQEEFTRFAPGLTACPVAGTAPARKELLESIIRRGGEADAVCITSYDLLRIDLPLYQKLDFSLMALDEAQYIKNQNAAMTKAVKTIRAARRFALTGTPIENRLAELWSIFDYLMPGFLYAHTMFSRRFETPITRSKDPAATARLKQMTGPFILRRLKTEVLKDLPPKLEEVRYTRFGDEQRRLYDGQVIRMKGILAQAGDAGEDKIRIFAELMRIRQICCDPSLLFEDYHGGSAKREAFLELIRSAMGGGHRMLVFSQFTSMLSLLGADLEREGIPYYTITGATPKDQRIRLVREFNEGDVPVFLISLKAGGTGLNLTGADVVIHYDPWWNVAAQNQATDRAHRIGQTRQVTVYRIIVKGTIEEKILALQEAKRDLADAILSGENASLASLSNEELLELLA